MNNSMTKLTIVRDDVSVKVFAVLGVLLTVLGTVGNVISIIVLNRRNMRRLKIRPYLIALAVFDLLCLYIILLPAVARFVKENQGTTRKPWHCKAMLFSGFFILDCSSWMTVAISIERLLYVIRPFMVRPQKGTAIAISSVIGLVAVINIPIANGWTAFNGKCHTEEVIFVVHFIISSYIPATIMVVSNVIIVNSLCRRPKVGSGAPKHNNSIRMAVGINMIFLCTTFPVSIVWVVTGKLYLPLYALLYANNAVNFASYIITGEAFRKELKCILYAKSVCCQKSEKPPLSVTQASETVSTTGTSV